MAFYFITGNKNKFKELKSILSVFCLAVFLIPQIALADSLGDKNTFYIDSSYDYDNRSEISATLRKAGKHSYFYVEDSYWNKLSSIEKNALQDIISDLSEEFDRTIYPKEREVFGEEFSPGIDNDLKITILLTEMSKDPGGYFNSVNEYTKEKNSNSNEREMIYLNTIYLNNPRAKSFLAHEFQHLISWNQKENLQGVADEVWLNEARSEYAPTICGYDSIYKGSNLEARINNFQKNSSDSLTEWQNAISDYPPVNLFMQYLTGRFGENILKEIMGSNKIGIASINAALEKIGSQKTFSDIFTDWTIANYINDSSISSGKYGYANSNLDFNALRISPTSTYQISPSINISASTSIKDWAGSWYRFETLLNPLFYEEKNILKLNFKGEDTGKFKVPYITTDFNGNNEVNLFTLDNKQDGTVYIPNFGKEIFSVTIIPSSQNKKSGFGDNELRHSFSYFAEMIKVSPAFADGTLVRAKNDFKIYLIESGLKRWVKSSEIFLSRWKWDDVIVVEKKEIFPIPIGNNVDTFPEGTLIKGNGDSVYVISDEKKRWIASLEIFNALGYKWENIFQISEEELNLIPIGSKISDTDIHPNGNLIRGADGKVYLIENGLKRWIKNPEIFEKHNFKWQNIISVSNLEISKYPLGLPIDF